MADIPTQEPASQRAGDTWRWNRDLADYPAGTWVLKYRFRNADAGFEIVAGVSGSTHAITAAATATAEYPAGRFTWIAWVESGAEKYTVAEGTMDVQADYRGAAAATAPLDDRTHARKMLDAIEAWLESRDMAVAEYEIAGRRMRYIPIADLLKLRSRYRLEVDGEEAKQKLARGEHVGRRIQFRM
jgi:hypothetical protein